MHKAIKCYCSTYWPIIFVERCARAAILLDLCGLGTHLASRRAACIIGISNDMIVKAAISPRIDAKSVIMVLKEQVEPSGMLASAQGS